MNNRCVATCAVIALNTLIHAGNEANHRPEILRSIKEQGQSISGIVLTSNIISLIDGVPWAVNANTIKLMLHVRREIRKIQFGDLKPDGDFEGHYLFNGQKLSLRQLALIESSYETDYYKKDDELHRSKTRCPQDFTSLELQYAQAKQELRTCLEQAKNEFELKMAPFEKNIRGTKSQIVVLIEESCRKRKSPDSILLQWADIEEGKEIEVVRKQIVTFKAFDQFCTDLVNFLEDIMHSCPKAWTQFKKLMETKPSNTSNK